MLADNPYTPPESTGLRPIEGSGRVWRSGKFLRMEKNATLPLRCVRCNSAAEKVLERKMYWHSPWWALTIFLGLLTYAIIALIVRKRADVSVGLCAAHARTRRNTLAIACSLPILGLAAFFVVPSEFFGVATLFAMLAVLFAIGLSQRHASVLRPVRIDDREVHLVGAAEPFLASLEREAA